MNKSNLAIAGIVAAAVVGFLIIFGGMIAGANNAAVGYEQTVKEQSSVIQVQLQRRQDLITALVSAVEAAGNFEKSTLKDVIEMRRNVSTGNVEGAMVNINALTEAYPDIKSVAAYTQLMTELSTTENLIAEQRKTYNSSVRSYQAFTRRFPNSLFLSIAGWHGDDYQYLELATPTYNPKIFGE